ncbi:ATP-binding protein [Gemmatimonas aurantiaca]|uniref:sensor histidine kinase n=1 Tax=Gemmatimonas aurantiaca TaxID=173480 RepID=UPI00301C0695
MGFVMAGIFAADTATSYEVAAAVFYAVVIMTAASGLSRRALIVLTAICIAITVLSFGITPHGDYRAGLINTGISIAAIVLTTYLILKMETATASAHDAQAQLMRITRVKSLEGLTTSIAHEVNQPLAAIVTSGNACQRWLAQDPPNLDKARQALDRILSDAGRASNIIARVRSLTRGEPPHTGEFEFNKAILEVVSLSQSEMERNDILLMTNLSPDLPPAVADRVQVQQVVGNLMLNAIEAMASTATSRRSIRIASELKDGLILLSVYDRGIGLPAGVYEHLFEAFWTTKEEGIGVGLSISRAIIEANGGQIWAEPIKEGGAVFRFSVPTTR